MVGILKLNRQQSLKEVCKLCMYKSFIFYEVDLEICSYIFDRVFVHCVNTNGSRGVIKPKHAMQFEVSCSLSGGVNVFVTVEHRHSHSTVLSGGVTVLVTVGR